jgi:hypothetical protein
MYEYISSLRPYFHSLREISDNVSLDIKLPLNWKYEEIIKQYKTIKPLTQDKDANFALLSLISHATKEGYDVIYLCAFEIIRVNKEEEEKQKLFQVKLKELQDLFKNESLDKLKDIDLKILFDGQKGATRLELVTKGDGQGFEGIGEQKTNDDKRTKKTRQAKNIPKPEDTTKETISLG